MSTDGKSTEALERALESLLDTNLTITLTFDKGEVGGMSALGWQRYAEAEMLKVRIAALEWLKEAQASEKRRKDTEAAAKRLATRANNKAKSAS